MFKKISSGKKNYKYFIGYLCDDYKTKPLYIILPKGSAYVKIYDCQTKWMYFLNKMMIYQKNIISFGKKSALILKIKSYDEATDFNQKKFLRQGLIIFI